MNSKILSDLENPYGALTIIRAPLMQVFNGSAYDSSYKIDDGSPTADNGNLGFYFTITTSVKSFKRRVHFVFEPNISGEGEFFFSEGATVSSGLPHIPYNMNRDGIPVPRSFNVVRSPTITNLGTVLLNYQIPAGYSPEFPIHYEWILRNSSEVTFTYRSLAVLYNRSGGPLQLGMKISVYDYEDE
jgi:hypothetical protein